MIINNYNNTYKCHKLLGIILLVLKHFPNTILFTCVIDLSSSVHEAQACRGKGICLNSTGEPPRDQGIENHFRSSSQKLPRDRSGETTAKFHTRANNPTGSGTVAA